ncbi:MAG: Fic family protein [Ruminococcus flavefaciens]|nr:Fic family protein [Ruminococcus flavefaciens]MCM1230414.1 Fic family protein [Ruminococcus flavefaciens]
MKTLSEKLFSERRSRYKGGIYHRLQIDFAYNSNHIEGSTLTHDQTRYIYETRRINAENAPVDDIIETVNHFHCFDHILDTLNEPLTEEYIKNLHKMLKSGVIAFEEYMVIGDYKTEANEVGGMETILPSQVSGKMQSLLNRFNGRQLDLYDIAHFHTLYKKIHPFYDGNGRTGRLIMLKQCLENNIVPFIINEDYKMFYYMGLKEWQMQDRKNRLIDVFLSAQDDMKSALDYFGIDYDRTEYKCGDILAIHPD